MAQQSFSAQVDAWVTKSRKRARTVVQQSALRVIQEAQRVREDGGRMRVDTGFLRASGQISLTAPPAVRADAKPDPDAGPGAYDWRETDVSLVILGVQLGQTIYFGYTAAYAAAREYGANGQPPDAFVRGAAQLWPQIVEETVREAKRRLP